LNIYGYDNFEELASTPHKRDTPGVLCEYEIRQLKRRRGEYVPPVYELSIIRKNGDIRYLEVFRKQVLWNGEMQFQALYADITNASRPKKICRKATSDIVLSWKMRMKPSSSLRT